MNWIIMDADFGIIQFAEKMSTELLLKCHARGWQVFKKENTSRMLNSCKCLELVDRFPAKDALHVF